MSTIEKGWTVYDALERPVGNVTDVDETLLRVDGRPESMGYLEIPTSRISRVDENEVHLSVHMETLTDRLGERTPEPLPTMRETAATRGTDSPATRGEHDTSDRGGTPLESGERVVVTAGRRSESSGSGPTASNALGGPGTGTSSAHGGSDFTAWEDDVIDGGSVWTRMSTWLGTAGLGIVGVLAYLWWQRRQARQTRIARLQGALRTTRESVGESVEPIWDAARERSRGWWLASLLALPLVLYLRSSRRGDLNQAEDASTDVGMHVQDLKSTALDRLRSLRSTESTTEEDTSLLWIALPALVAALAAWYATRRRPSGRSGSLGEIMTGDVQVTRPEATVFEAASLMKRLGVGSLPVCDGRRLQGMLTDRDIVVRAIADGRDPRTVSVGEVMSPGIVYAFENDSITTGADLMRTHQIRRLPIVDRDKSLVGIVALGDVAVETGDDDLSGSTLEGVSERSRRGR